MESHAQAYEIPGPMIEIAVNIYEYRLDNEKQLGLFYQYNSKSGSFQNSDVFLPGTENLRDNPIRALDISGSFAKLKYGSVDFNLKTAIQEGRATIISNPIMLTADGQRASILSGEEIPLTVLKLQGFNTVLDTETRPTGIKLIVTPRIYRDEFILMELEIESSEITRFDVFDRGDHQRYELPVVSKRNIKTVVMIPSSQQLYIGGLYTSSTGDLVRKVPIVGDLPVVGFFLRGFNKKKRQTETVFQITPTIRHLGMGVSTDDNIFRDLLKTGETEAIIDEQQYLNEASMRSPFQNLIPPPSGQPIPQNAPTMGTPGATDSSAPVIEPTPTAESKPIFRRPKRYNR